MKFKKVLATMTICGILSMCGSFTSNASAGAGELLSTALDESEEGVIGAGVADVISEALGGSEEEIEAETISRKELMEKEQERIRKEYEDAKRAEEEYQRAEQERKQQELETALLDFQDTLKTRDETVIQITNSIGPVYGIKPTLLQAIIWYESTNYQYAENRGCCGYMQVNPKWHYDKIEHHQVSDIFDKQGNILMGSIILSELLEKNGGNLPLSLMEYNGDSRARYLNSIGDMSSYARKIINLDYRLTLLEELYAKYQ